MSQFDINLASTGSANKILYKILVTELVEVTNNGVKIETATLPNPDIMETILLLLSIVLLFAGLLGCILPAIPGPPLSYVALLLTQWAIQPFGTSTLIIFAILTVAVTILDYVIPAWSAKLFGATKYGVWGSIIGMLVGTFLTPVGMIAGLLAGAILGDLYGGKPISNAIQSGLATFLGTLAGIVIKLILSGIITFMVFYKTIAWLSEKI